MCVSTCCQCYGVILFYISISEFDVSVINSFTPARHGDPRPRGQTPEYLNYHCLTRSIVNPGHDEQLMILFTFFFINAKRVKAFLLQKKANAN